MRSDNEIVSEWSLAHSEGGHPATVGVTGANWTNFNVIVDGVIGHKPTSDNLCCLDDVKINLSVYIDGRRGFPDNINEDGTDSNTIG